ncbi:MAG: FtsH protease activity modulator HflK [Lentisphaeria bacterium]
MNGFDNQQPELVQALREFFQKGGLTLIIVIGLLIFIGIGLATSVYSVQTQGRAVVKRFGEAVSIKKPGLKWKLPFGIDKAYFVPTKRVLKEEFGFRTEKPARRTTYSKTDATSRESLMLTGDLNVIDVEWVVQYRITDPKKYLHAIRRPRETIRDTSEAVMRRIVGNRVGRDVVTGGRVEVAAESKSELKRILDEYDFGVSVQRVELQDVTPPDPVKPAYNEVNEAQQQRERLINEAEKYRNQMIPKARGEADQTVAEAQAYQAERENSARGGAARFTAILEEYEKAKKTTRRRLFLEMIDEVLPRLGKVYVMDPSQNSALPLLDLGGESLRNKNN